MSGGADRGADRVSGGADRASRGERAVREVPVQLDRSSGVPLPAQLAAALREAIDAANLRAGEGVPATREFARRLGVARGVVVAAYEQLIAEGYLTATHGGGTRVNPELGATRGRAGGGADPRFSASEPAQAAEAVGPLAPGVPITDAVVGPAWRAAWREAAARAELAAPPLGDPRLREEIAEHLRRMRGTPRTARDVLVTAGTRDGLGLLLTALREARGRDLVVGVEDPGLPSLRGVAERHGAETVALPADAEGLDTRRLPSGGLDLVIVTPSHQYPLGGSLPLPRRRELLAWAGRAGVVIVEDDFDSELRYTGSPLPTLTALDDPAAGSVVLLGTFSRTVAPGLSAGYLLAPAGLRALVEPVRRELGGPVSGVVQAALARYLASGELRRHTARMLRRYAARRDALSDRLAGATSARVRPMDGGLHAVIELLGGSAPERLEREARLAASAEGRALGAQALGRYWQRREGDELAGLVIGVGGSDDAEFDRALTRLRSLLDASQ